MSVEGLEPMVSTQALSRLVLNNDPKETHPLSRPHLAMSLNMDSVHTPCGAAITREMGSPYLFSNRSTLDRAWRIIASLFPSS
jgi:hypothetical protein